MLKEEPKEFQQEKQLSGRLRWIAPSVHRNLFCAVFGFAGVMIVATALGDYLVLDSTRKSFQIQRYARNRTEWSTTLPGKVSKRMLKEASWLSGVQK